MKSCSSGGENHDLIQAGVYPVIDREDDGVLTELLYRKDHSLGNKTKSRGQKDVRDSEHYLSIAHPPRTC